MRRVKEEKDHEDSQEMVLRNIQLVLLDMSSVIALEQGIIIIKSLPFV